MIRILATAFLAISMLASSQSIEELDNKGGFKDFKIGDTLTAYGDRIKPMKTLDNADTKLYLVKERISVKNYTGEVELEFYKGLVQEIIVSFKTATVADFEDIKKSLETLYGEGEKSKSKTPETTRFAKLYTWSGKKINLRIGYDEKYKLVEMVYSGHAHDLEKLKKEF